MKANRLQAELRTLSPEALFLLGVTATRARDRNPIFAWTAVAARAVVAGRGIPPMPEFKSEDLDAALEEVMKLGLAGAVVGEDEDEETQAAIVEVEAFLVLVHESLKAIAQAPDSLH